MKKTIVNVSKDIKGVLNTLENPQEAFIDENAAQMINVVMKVMMSVKPAWRTSFKTEDEINGYKQELCHAFIENKLTFKQIESGSKKVRQCPSPFMPSVGQFIQWCTEKKIKQPSHRVYNPDVKDITKITEEQRQKSGKQVVHDIRSQIAKKK